MEDLGWAGMRIVPTFQGFRSHLQAGTRSATGSVASAEGSRFGTGFATRAGHSIRSKFSESAKYVLGPLVGALAVEKIGETIAEAIHSASDLEGAQARANVIFGKGSEEVDKFGARAAKSLGLSELSATRAATGFGLLGQRMGLSGEENVKFSERFTGIANDLAAFNRSDPETAFLALQRGVAGATRGLKPYGVLIDSTAIKAEALADGILKPVKNQAAIHSAQVRVLEDQIAYTKAVNDHGKNSLDASKADAALGTAQDSLNKATEGAVPTLTQQQKMLAATKLIMKQTEQQQGSFKKSSGSLYGEQRRLNASWADAKDRIGKGLMPVMVDLAHGINRNVIPAVDRASTWFEHKGGPAIHHFERELAPLVHETLPLLATTFDAIATTAEDLLPTVTGIVGGFNKLPDGVKKAIAVGAGATYLAKRTGILGSLTGRAGATTLAGEAASLAHPIPVFVTNEGFGATGTGGKVPPVVATGAEATAAEEAAAAAAGKSGLLARLFGKGALARFGGAALSAPAMITLADSGAEVGAPPHMVDMSKGLAGSPGPIGGFSQDFKGNVDVNESWAQLDKTLSHLAGSGNLEAVNKQLRVQATIASEAFKQPLAESYRQLDQVLPKTTAKMDRWTRGTISGQRVIRDFGRGFDSAMGEVTSRTNEFRTDLGKLPKAVQTKITAPGADLSRQQALNLARQYNLTPKQVSTLFTVLGIDRARQQITGLLGIYRAGIPSTGGRTVSDPTAVGGGGGGSGSGGAGSGTQVHLHLDRLTVQSDGRTSAVARAEIQENGRFTRQRVEAGSR